jgi:glucuronoarabinoxylan endo-1,4-beta-xylanase
MSNTLEFAGRALIATIVFAAVRPAVAQTQVTVYPQTVLQRIDGFGASDAWYAWEIHSFSPSQQTAILDDLFSPTVGAGLSLLRHRVPFEIEPSPGVWDWTTDNDTVWLSQQAVARGVSRIWSTVWSPPAWMKTNNNVNEGGAVEVSHYRDYATFLATYVQHYASSFGVTVSGISIANEPDITASYESSNWNSSQFHDFIRNDLAPVFQKAGLQTQVMMPEISGWTDSFAAATLADPVTANFVGIINSHDYWGTLAPFVDAQKANKPVWETEVSNLGADDPTINDGIAWAIRVHQTLVNAQANAWHYWWLYSDVGDTTGQSLISGSPSTNTFTTKKRLWTIGNFSRFVRPGWHMVGVSSNQPASGVYVTAFTNAFGEMAIVAINSSSAWTSLSVNSGRPFIGSAIGYRTSATEDLSPVGAAPLYLGAFASSLAPTSVTTFVLRSPFVVAP